MDVWKALVHGSPAGFVDVPDPSGAEEQARDVRAGGPRCVWSAVRVRRDGVGGFQWCQRGLKSCCAAEAEADTRPHFSST